MPYDVGVPSRTIMLTPLSCYLAIVNLTYENIMKWFMEQKKGILHKVDGYKFGKW
jgi:hypothetical protein